MRSDIPLTSLMVDTENPRLQIQPAHRDAVRELFGTATKKMLQLTQDIAEQGSLNPLEKIGVSPSPSIKTVTSFGKEIAVSPL